MADTGGMARFQHTPSARICTTGSRAAQVYLSWAIRPWNSLLMCVSPSDGFASRGIHWTCTTRSRTYFWIEICFNFGMLHSTSPTSISYTPGRN